MEGSFLLQFVQSFVIPRTRERVQVTRQYMRPLLRSSSIHTQLQSLFRPRGGCLLTRVVVKLVARWKIAWVNDEALKANVAKPAARMLILMISRQEFVCLFVFRLGQCGYIREGEIGTGRRKSERKTGRVWEGSNTKGRC